MATSKLYLDTRSAKKGGKYPLKVSVSYHGKTVLVGTNIDLCQNQWRDGKVVDHAQKDMLNRALRSTLASVDATLVEMEVKNTPYKDIKREVEARLHPEKIQPNEPTLRDWCTLSLQGKTLRTREIYYTTLHKIEEYDKSITLHTLSVQWLRKFDAWLQGKGNGTNTRAIDMRNIRHIYNYAMAEDASLLSLYPFRQFKIERKKTPYRTLSVDDLVIILVAPLSPSLERYRELFLVQFFLLGINVVDLYHATPSSIVQGRLHYNRAKTGKEYSVKILPIVARHIHPTPTSLHPIMQGYTDYRLFTARYNKALATIADICKIDKITSYYSRYSWANIAHRIGIPKDTISMALGHSFGNKTTDIYIDYDSDKVDDANETMLAYIYYKVLLWYAHIIVIFAKNPF